MKEILDRLYGSLEERLPLIGKTSRWLRWVRENPDQRLKKRHLQQMKSELLQILEMIDKELQ